MRATDPAVHEGRAHRVPVNLGQVAIEHDHVVSVEERLLHSGRAVVGDIGRDSLVSEPLCEVVGQVHLVLHDQNPHASILSEKR